MSLEADAGAVSEIDGEAGGGDGDSEDGKDGRKGLDLRVGSVGDVCGGGGDNDGGDDGKKGHDADSEDGRMSVEADSGAVSEVKEDIGSASADPAPAATDEMTRGLKTRLHYGRRRCQPGNQQDINPK